MKQLLWALLLVSFNIFAAPVDINRASAQEMSESLKGIGLKKAQAIVTYRKANGPFASINDLANVKGIGEKTIAKNKNNLKTSAGKKTISKNKNNLKTSKGKKAISKNKNNLKTSTGKKTTKKKKK